MNKKNIINILIFVPFIPFFVLMMVRIYGGLVQESFHAVNIITVILAIVCGVIAFLTIPAKIRGGDIFMLARIAMLVVSTALLVAYVILLSTGWVGWAFRAGGEVFITPGNIAIAVTTGFIVVATLFTGLLQLLIETKI